MAEQAKEMRAATEMETDKQGEAVSGKDDNSETEDGGVKVIEQTSILLLNISEVFVYRIPPYKGSVGHRAADWDLGNPLVTASLQVVGKGGKVYVQIIKDGKLFASSPIYLEKDKEKPNSKLEFYLQSVNDSSRYFVLRVENETTNRHAYLGIGFRERQSAFDLRAALDDELRRSSRLQSLENARTLDDHGEHGEDKPLPPLKGMKDLSLKEGETIKVNLNIPKRTEKAKPKKKPKGETPTSAKDSAVQTSTPATSTQSGAIARDQNTEEDFEWGDFQS